MKKSNLRFFTTVNNIDFLDPDEDNDAVVVRLLWMNGYIDPMSKELPKLLENIEPLPYEEASRMSDNAIGHAGEVLVMIPIAGQLLPDPATRYAQNLRVAGYFVQRSFTKNQQHLPMDQRTTCFMRKKNRSCIKLIHHTN